MVLKNTYAYYEQYPISLNNSLIHPGKLVRGLFVLYIFLSYFEIFLAGFIGTSTKYLMLLLIACFLYQFKGKLRVHLYWISFLIWFLYWCVSIMWSPMANDIVRTHFLSQIGIVLFIIALDGQVFDEEFIRLNLQWHLFCSSLFGILSVLFHNAYIDNVLVARQVLTLFGRQNDPNNCAAFLLVGIAISLYCAIYEKKYILLHIIIIAINSYATLLTGSRAGFVGIGFIAVIFVFLPSQERKIDIKGGIKKIAILIIAGLAIYYFVKHYLPVASLDRLLAFNEYQEGSGRTMKWQRILEYYYQKPVFGWGWGGLDFSSIGYVSSAHNTFLTMLCEGGFFGLALFMIPIVSLTVNAIKTKNVMVIILLICGLFPAFLIDAINKRFFWNAIIIAILLTNYYRSTGRYVSVWNTQEVKG